jgi:hypothetical protein
VSDSPTLRSAGRFSLFASAIALCWAVFAFVAMMVYARNPALAKAITGAVSGAIFGSIAGASRWALFRGRLGPGHSVLVTALGWGFAGIAVGAMGALSSPGRLGGDYQFGMVLGGVIVGLSEWVLLRGGMKRAIWSFALLAVGWGLGGVISWSLYERLSVSGVPVPNVLLAVGDEHLMTEVVGAILGAAVGGLVVGVASALIAVKKE